MLYETRMLEREQAAGKAGYEQGMQRGIKQGRAEGKIDVAKVILENQIDNGSTLEQATKFVKDLKIISDKDLEKLVKIYKENSQIIIIKTPKDC